MGFADQMISSLKNNSRRKRAHIPFEKIKENEHSYPIKSKDFNQLSKKEITQILKQKKVREKENAPIKIILTLIITIVLIAGIIFALKFTFF